ncbi:MAG TPA: hypothetical protein PLK76_03550 [bacterium]|jgi:hypothetical protein|nr:hypothetical protein [bacterium]
MGEKTYYFSPKDTKTLNRLLLIDVNNPVGYSKAVEESREALRQYQ